MDKGIQSNQDIIQIEKDLLNELEGLDKKFPNSSSTTSSQSCHDISETSIFDHIVNDCQDLDTEISYDGINDLLSAIPGYEVFKESVEISSISCLEVLETVDSVKHLVGNEDNIVSKKEECIRKSIESDVTENNTPVEKLDICMENEVCKVRTMDSADDIEASNSCSINNTSIHSHSQVIHTNDEGPTASCTFLKIMRDTMTPISEILEAEEEAQLEAEKEIIYQEQKRKETILQRANDAMKERIKILTQNKAAQCLQRSFKEYLRRKSCRRIRSILKGHIKLCSLIETLTTKVYFWSWNEYSIQTRLAVMVQYQIRIYLKKRQIRKAKLSKALCQFISKKSVRMTFTFWKIFSSAMKLQENLMHKFTNSALIIECAFRRYQAQTILKALKRNSASITIQKHYRGYWNRMRVGVMKDEMRWKRKVKSAMLIQRYYRGYMTRIRLIRVRNKNYSFIDLEVDKILNEEADDILEQILGACKDENSSTLNHWKPCKPERLKSSETLVEHPSSRIDNNNKVNTNFDDIQNHVGNKQIDCMQIQHTGAFDTTSDSVSSQKVHSDQIEKSLKQHKDGGSDVKDVMKEWNFNDQRVVKVSQSVKEYMKGCFKFLNSLIAFLPLNY